MTANAAAEPGARPPWPRDVTCWLAYAAIGVAYNVLGPVLPALRPILHAGYGALAVLFVAPGMGSAAANVLGNRLLDRVGYRRLLVAAAVAYALVLLTMLGVHLLALWAGVSVVGGFAGAIIDIAGARYIAGSRGEGRGGALNLLNVFYGVGGLVAPLAVGALAAIHGDVIWAYGLAAAIMLAVAAFAAAAMRQGRPTSGEATAIAGWRWAVGQPALVRLSLVIALYVGVEVAFAGWVAAYAHARDGLGVSGAAVFPLLFFAALTAGRSLAAERARRWSEASLVGLGMALALAGGLVSLAAPGPPALALGVVLAGIGCGPVFPTVFALAARRAPSHQSEAYGLLFVSSGVGNLTLPWLAGQLFARIGAWAALGLPVACTAAMAAIFAYASARDASPGPAAAGSPSA